MRVAIFDGILETHVASSLERSLVRFGHTVLNTGKIGSGFHFPKLEDKVPHLEYAVQRIIDFDADLVLVMRPASLPIRLLSKLRKDSRILVAWFSDDPVLFDLTYGPVVDYYDLVLHCGNTQVLDFYENYFGYPTGVNFPFWTDHDAFPFVWGTKEATTDLMFLGNVHDRVRRKRYFDLGKLDLDVRVHGNIGADYFDLNGGYLYTDDEVAEAGSTTRMALNIPQFFRDHRGLDTWFPGLDELGFFEYPSRVVQYMAMGIPTISVIPGDVEFSTYPEMVVASSIQEAGEVAQDLIRGDQLSAMSQKVLKRFDRNFSADSRVLALMRLLEDDSWRRLDSFERTQWFVQFDALTHTDGGDIPPGKLSNTRCKSAVVVDDKVASTDSSERVSVALLYGGDLRGFSRSAAIYESLKDRKDVDFVVKRRDEVSEAFTDDPQGICESALLVPKLEEACELQKVDVLLISDIDVAITQKGAEELKCLNVRSAIVDDFSGASDWRHYERLITGFDKVFSPNFALVEEASNLGFDNVGFLPYFVKPSFLDELDKAEGSNAVIKVRENVASEAAQVPAFEVDGKNVTKVDYDFEDLGQMSTAELARALKCDMALMSFRGPSSSPSADPLSPYVVVASKTCFVARNAAWQILHPYEETSLTVKEPGELRAKLNQLNEGYVQERDSASLELLRTSNALTSQIMELCTDGRPASSENLPLRNGWILQIEPDHKSQVPIGKGQSILLSIETRGFVGAIQDWWFKVRLAGNVIHGQHPSGTDDIVVNNVNDPSLLAVEFQYLGRSMRLNASKAINVSVTSVALNGLVKGEKRGSAFSITLPGEGRRK